MKLKPKGGGLKPVGHFKPCGGFYPYDPYGGAYKEPDTGGE